MQIVKYPNKILRKKLEIFSDFHNPELPQIAKDLFEKMKSSDGVGLAGNQVGSEIRFVAVDTKSGDSVFFNPKIIKHSFLKQRSEEGCLSFPGIFGFVSRYRNITIEYQDINGAVKQIKARGLLSYVFQHEIDHINGIVFIDKIKKFTAGKDKLAQLKQIAKVDEI